MHFDFLFKIFLPFGLLKFVPGYQIDNVIIRSGDGTGAKLNQKPT